MICPQFYDAMCFSQWPYKWWHPKNDFILVAWVSCGGHFKHNHHLPWHWPLLQSKKNKATICCLCFDDGREMSNPMTSSEQKETLEQVWTFLRDVVTHHFLFSGLTSKLGRYSTTRISKAKTRDFSAGHGQKTRLSAEFSLGAFLRKSFEWIWFGDTFFEWLTLSNGSSGENSNFQS